MRQTTGASLFACCLSLLVAVGLGMTPASAAKVSGPSDSLLRPAAILTVITGDVRMRAASGDFTSAVDGAVLNVGSAIRTSPDARAVITLFDGSTIPLEPASDITIEDATPGSGPTLVESLGRGWRVVTNLTTADSRNEQRTPAATASVRGIELEVTANDGPTGRSAASITTGRLTATAAVATSVAVPDETRVVASAQTNTVRAKSAPASGRSARQPVRAGQTSWPKDRARDHERERDDDEDDREDDD